MKLDVSHSRFKGLNCRVQQLQNNNKKEPQCSSLKRDIDYESRDLQSLPLQVVK